MGIFAAKYFRPALVSLLSAVALWALSALAADEKMTILKAGSQTFTNVTVISRTPVELCITHVGGIANVRLKDLEPELQTKFGYDPAAAEAEEKRRAEAKAKGTVPGLSSARRRSPQAGESSQLPWEETNSVLRTVGWTCTSPCHRSIRANK